MCPWTPSRTGLLWVLGYVITIYEKSVGSLPSPVPQFEAFALPNPVRTSNTEAHACMHKSCGALNRIMYTCQGYLIHTHEHLPLPCSLTGFESCKVSNCQEQSVSKRLIHKWFPLPLFPHGLLHRCHYPKGLQLWVMLATFTKNKSK